MAPRATWMPKRPGGAGGKDSVAVQETGPKEFTITTESAVPAATGWLLRGKDGRLTAYAPVADAILRWTETSVGGPGWAGPDRLPIGGRVKYFSLAQSTQGYVHLVVLRERPVPGGPDETDIVHAIQFQTARPLRQWLSIGNPHGKDLEKAPLTGFPSAVVDLNGSLHVYMRNGNGNLSAKQQVPSGRWGRWTGAAAKDAQLTGEVTAAGIDGRLITIMGPAGDTTIRWVKEEPGSPLKRLGEVPAARIASGSVAIGHTGPERLTYFWRGAEDGTLHAWRPGGEPVPLGGRGAGAPALLRTPVDGQDCTVLAQCSTDGRLSIAAYPTEDETVGLNWTATGGSCAGAPALALDGQGRVVLAAVASDGSLRVARQKAEDGLALAAWERF